MAVMLTVSTWLPTMLATTYWNKLIYIYIAVLDLYIYVCMYVGRYVCMYVLNIYTNKQIYIFVCVAINFEY